VTTPSEADERQIHEASRETGVPKRTIYRWVESGRLKSRTVDGQQVVSLEAVRALAAARDAGADFGGAVPRAGNGAGNGTGTALATPSANDGALAARVFTAFDSGKMPAEVVREMELPPRVVLDLWKQHGDLREVSQPGRPTVADRVGALEGSLNGLAMRFDEATFAGMIGDEVRSLRAGFEEVRQVLATLPVPLRGSFKCTSCGSAGWVASQVRCTACGRDSTWGFHPHRE